VDSSQITTEQAEKIKDAIGPAHGYLTRLVRRMERRGFPPDDRLFQLAREAQDRMQHLWITLHYMSIKRGVGCPPKPR
jgi:hypothetical protein